MGNTENRIIKLAIGNIKLISENRRLRPGNGRLTTTQAYKNYKQELGFVFRPQIPLKWKTIDGKFGVKMEFRTYDRKDAQNLIKPILDVIESLGIVKNDKSLSRLLVLKQTIPNRDMESAIVTIQEDL